MAELTSISVLITTAAAAAIGLISQVQHSRCTSLDIGCGLIRCVRSVPDVEEEPVELIPQSARVTD